MLVPVRGVLVVADSQTGDGRYIVPAGAMTWAPLPLPFSYIVDGDQHVDLINRAPQIGNIQTIELVGNEYQWTGIVDDEIPAGAELLRRMRAGSAGLGNRNGVSIDPDDWALQVIDTTEQINSGDDEEVVVASISGHGRLEPYHGVRAAAGDGDPTGVVVYEDASDMWVQRFTRLRIRGVTACAVAAFTEAYVEIASEADTPAEEVPAEGEEAADETVTAGSGLLVVASANAPLNPPRAWLYEPEPAIDDERMVEQFDRQGNPLGFACPLTITDDGQVFGHAAAGWAQCHVGYQECVNPPASASAYAHFHVGEVVTAEGDRVATGVLTVGCDHAAAHLMATQAKDHYANVGLGWADVRVIDGEHAPWVAGALRPGLDEATVRVLRATVLSGDWRRIGTNLELIALQSVNNPGFPIAREALAASAIGSLAAAGGPVVHVENGVQLSLVAASPATRCPECQKRLMAANAVGPERHLETLERRLLARTQHLIPAARDALLSDIRRG